ncbi:MAG TPA: HupE/UreJ family protein, partial [Polyangia bacterium]|nr:HupE/UreJ family protein [Polyangia bacterium]
TLAHSLTLGLCFFGVMAPRAQWVEVAIAVSVFAAAWNNLRPFLPGRAWMIALAFGLIHGLGFAGALRNLALPIGARGFALAAFNVGVELGQLAIVAVLLPLLHLVGRRPFYPRIVMGAGSLAIAWLAALWFVERGFGLPVLGAAAAFTGR